MYIPWYGLIIIVVAFLWALTRREDEDKDDNSLENVLKRIECVLKDIYGVVENFRGVDMQRIECLLAAIDKATQKLEGPELERIEQLLEKIHEAIPNCEAVDLERIENLLETIDDKLPLGPSNISPP